MVIHAGAVANSPKAPIGSRQLIGGSWRHGQTRSGSKARCTSTSPIARTRSRRTARTSTWTTRSTTTWTSLPEAAILAAAYTPKPRDTAASGNKEAQARAAEAVKKGGVNIYDIQPQMWTYEKDAYRAFVSIPGHSTRTSPTP